MSSTKGMSRSSHCDTRFWQQTSSIECFKTKYIRYITSRTHSEQPRAVTFHRPLGVVDDRAVTKVPQMPRCYQTIATAIDRARAGGTNSERKVEEYKDQACSETVSAISAHPLFPGPQATNTFGYFEGGYTASTAAATLRPASSMSYRDTGELRG